MASYYDTLGVNKNASQEDINLFRGLSYNNNTPEDRTLLLSKLNDTSESTNQDISNLSVRVDTNEISVKIIRTGTDGKRSKKKSKRRSRR